MGIKEVIEKLQGYLHAQGDIRVVLYDLDTGYYFALQQDHLELQEMDDGSIRVSIGLNNYQGQSEQKPKKRPI